MTGSAMQAAKTHLGRDTAILTVRDLTVSYRMGWRRRMQAVVDVSLDIGAGETVALIGESGSGKSTFARAICGLESIESGSVRIGGQDLARVKNPAAVAGDLGIAIVFQDSASALDPRWPVWRSITEPCLHRFPSSSAARMALARKLAIRVGLDPRLVERRPHQLSGGQRQRVTIARSLAGRPRLIILDEAVSALDVSVRNEILSLLDVLKREEGLTYLFISHDMGAVAQIASRIAVLYLGRLVEVGEAGAVVGNASHPYTRALLSAVPTIEGFRPANPIEGDTGDPANPPTGCRFHPRCVFHIARCSSEEPMARSVGQTLVACHRAEEALASADPEPDGKEAGLTQAIR